MTLGNYALFGLTKNPQFSHNVKQHLNISPRLIDFGSQGSLFFYSNRGQTVESETDIVLKIGFTRSPDLAPLSAGDLLTQKIIQALQINSQAVRGNAMLACFSKSQPQLTIYQTLMALPQLYYYHTPDTLICATDIRVLLPLLDKVEVNEDVIPFHFLFLLSPGPMTYLKNVKRLFPGQSLTWDHGDLRLKLEQDFRFLDADQQIQTITDPNLDTLYERMSGVMSAYLQDIKAEGHQAANFLSGGVDSSILQLLIKENSAPSEKQPSYSFAFDTPAFQFEIGYAQQASQLLNTKHTIIDVPTETYPDLLIRSISTLGQPTLMNEAEPAKLALAEYMSNHVPHTNYYFAGQAADALNGVSEARKVILFERAKKIPAARIMFEAMSAILAVWSKSKSAGLKDVALMLAQTDDPNSFLSPPNYVAAVSQLDTVCKYFGEQAVLKAFEQRRNLEATYIDSRWMLEKIQMIDLLTAGYEPAVIAGQFFAAQQKELIQFFLDEDIIRATLAFHPKVRFLKGLNTKPLLKQILTRHSLGVIAHKKKGATNFDADIYDWMTHGPLQDLIHQIDLPASLTPTELQRLIKTHNDFPWCLLTFDLFKKHIIQPANNS